jgi:hypothetical protein
MTELMSERGTLEKGFGGDASPEHTGPAQTFSLDEADIEAELGGTDCAHVSRRTPTYEDHVK